MYTHNLGHKKGLRATALLVAVSLVAPAFLGCSSNSNQSGANLPPVDETRGGQVAPTAAPQRQAPRRGLTTNQKLLLLAGAAALYYMYKKHKNAQNQPANVQYYLSKNGRVYYRDATGRAHWVTPPPNGIQVPESEVRDMPELQNYRGYNGSNTGQDFGGVAQGSPGY
ncbi:MAG TPA: hypothetical protein VFB38_04000 [Chthonomonadaceae bacterium]|nr:hypothetical protein [Chthonomonadaceae bacterium]